ncbi:Canalicular multispecific organic anion transporter 2 [Ranunculus cassubicifolius]
MEVNYDFLLSLSFVHGLSAFSHLILLLVLSANCVFRGRPKTNNGSSVYHKPAFFSCISLALFHLILCVSNYFYFYTNYWSLEKTVTQLDLLLMTLSWSAVSVYLYYSTKFKALLFLRIWWVFFFFLSAYSLLSDFTHQSIPTHLWIKDVVSSVLGMFFLYIGVFGFKEGKQTLLQQPLLSDSFRKNPELDSPFSKAGFFSVLTFSWLGPLLDLGNKKTLDLKDVPPLDSADSVNRLFPNFRDKLYSYSPTSEQISTLKLVKALLFATWKEILVTGLFCFLYTIACYVGPTLIDTFVQYLNGRREFENQGYILVSAFLFAKIVESFSQRHWFFRLQQVGIRVRATLIAMVYKKGQTLSTQSKQDHTSGEIINIMAVDAERIGDFSWFIHDMWMVPVQVILALLILYKNLGLASIAALVATVLVMLANIPFGKLQENFQEKLMESKDARMKRTTEILRNMRILKLQSWEMKFLSKVMELRKNEEGWLRKYLYTSAATIFIFWGAPTFVSVITFSACVLMGIPLESGKILSSLATFKILQEPIYTLPDTIQVIAQTKVSLDRIASFLRLNDLPPDAVENLAETSEVSVKIKDGYFSWDSSSSSGPTLKNINFQAQRGMRVAVCGTVGSGKSSLLSCILGEVPKVSGTVKVCGRKAYVAQSPWIQSGTIQENILFGKEMDRERYERVLEACSLSKDLEILSFGDQTVIGERGINLSGGQKQRVQIARALYQDSDVYLFDDPFSAVDAHTGTHLFKECLLGLLASKTIIYVTHQVEFLPSADLILVMKDGTITQSGRYEDILNSGTDFMELVGAHKKALSNLSSEETGPESENLKTIEETSSAEYGTMVEHKEEKTVEVANKDGIVEPKSQLVQEEEREKGKVGYDVYWRYITTAYKGLLAPLILGAQILFQILQIASNYWMTWATPVSKDVKPPVEGSTLILVYVALAMGSSIFVLLRSVLLATAGYKTATILFNKMHRCIFRAPMSFFDATPSGRILNRASTDQSAVDLDIPNRIEAFTFLIVQLVGVVAVMSQVAWPVFIVFIPVIVACIWYQQYYISTARELARLIGVCKAPVIQHYSESIAGLTTIRSFDQEPRFMDTNLKLIDDYSRPKFYNASAMQWLTFRLDMLSSIIFAFSLIFLILVPEGTINPGIAGLAVTYGLNINMLQVWLISNLCHLENKIISVERMLQYTSIPSEPPLVVEESRPEKDWPPRGEIDIHDLQVRYAPQMPLVLRGITCTIPGEMKTGIVGRTGSGKSTLIQTLFRMVEPTSGAILIDGLNISKIGLHDLRSRLSIIPQDPTMFEGTVRSNLDPLEEYSDEHIWEALDKCQLGDEVRKKDGKLDSVVSENGENWSMGQRQLVCLGRVLLKKSQVLVLDEATASVDTSTDNLIQQTLRQHFSGSTVVTIAHRLTSVLDSDIVLLLDQGLILENDSPSKLLENKSSLFAKLVSEYTVRSGSSFGE